MPVYGYARVSTIQQDLTIQREALKAAGCSVIRAEKISVSSRKDREQLNTMLEFLQKGDVLMVTRIDRLARSIVSGAYTPSFQPGFGMAALRSLWKDRYVEYIATN